MSECIISVVGIAIITLLCDVILPDGQTRKYIKTILGIVVTFVIAQSVCGLFAVKDNVSINVNKSLDSQKQYIENATSRQIEKKVIELKSTLQSNGYNVQNIAVSQYDETVLLEIESGNSSTNSKIETIVERFFRGYEIIIIWK